MKRMYPRLPILFAGLGGAAFSLRLFLYIAATDEKGLLIPGHPLELLLWLLAARGDPACFSVVVCFAAFLVNDLYGFLSWRRMGKRQELR